MSTISTHPRPVLWESFYPSGPVMHSYDLMLARLTRHKRIHSATSGVIGTLQRVISNADRRFAHIVVGLPTEAFDKIDSTLTSMKRRSNPVVNFSIPISVDKKRRKRTV